jgi:hypothetical protein
MKRLLTIAALAIVAGACSSNPKSQTATPTTTARTTVSVPPSTVAAATPRRMTERVIAAFKRAGIPIGKVVFYNESTDPNKMLGRPHGYNARVSWADRRIDQSGRDEPEGGTIEVFDTPGMAMTRQQYIQGFAQAGPIFDEYDWLVPENSNFLLRISRELTPKQANQYRTVMERELTR